ncbi:MAG: hypothetical protein AAGL10_15245 [Pseudomonadota bacterium]
MPFEIRVTIAEQTLYPPRIAAFLLLPWLVFRLLRTRFRLVVWDILFMMSAFWMLVAFVINYGPATGFVRGGVLAFDIAVPYLAARMAVHDSNDFRRLLIVVAPGLMIAGSSMLAEVFAGRSLVRPFFTQIFGPLPLYQGGDAIGLASSASFERRLGILRASGPFSHPILAGLFLASFLPLYLSSSIRSWPFVGGVAASILSIFSASSAPILLLLMNAGLLLVDWGQRLVAFINWKLIVPSLCVLALLLHLGSQNGLLSVLIRLTLNPQTGYFRQLIWQYGTQSVAKHPLFGIGYEGFDRPTWMPESVDNHWLLLAMRYGLVPALGIGLVVIAAVIILCLKAGQCSELERKLHVGLAAGLFSFALLGFSVAFFGGIQTWFYVLVAISVSIASNPAKQESVTGRLTPRAGSPENQIAATFNSRAD